MDANRLGAWFYGGTLILIGVGLGAWGIVRIADGPGSQGGVSFVVSLIMLFLLALGAVVLAIERLQGRVSTKLRTFARPDEVLPPKREKSE